MNEFNYSDGTITISIKSEKEITQDIIVRILNALPKQTKYVPLPYVGPITTPYRPWNPNDTGIVYCSTGTGTIVKTTTDLPEGIPSACFNTLSDAPSIVVNDPLHNLN